MSTRREFLAHANCIGLGSLFLPHLGRFTRAAEETQHWDEVIFEPIRTDGLHLISYFVGDKKSGTAAVIDPRRDVDVFVELAAKHKLRITHALEMHIHADFVSGSRELANKLERLDKTKPVVVYCASGYRSSIATGILKRHGFTVYNVPGSYKAWIAAGYPVEKPKTPGRGTDTERN